MVKFAGLRPRFPAAKLPFGTWTGRVRKWRCHRLRPVICQHGLGQPRLVPPRSAPQIDPRLPAGLSPLGRIPRVPGLLRRFVRGQVAIAAILFVDPAQHDVIIPAVPANHQRRTHQDPPVSLPGLPARRSQSGTAFGAFPSP